MKSKKKGQTVIILLVLVVFLFPIKIEQHDITLYCSILYTVINAHKLDIGPKGDPSTYLVSGIKVFVLEITIYDNTESLINNSDGETE